MPVENPAECFVSPGIAAVEFAVDARRQWCSCISIPQTIDNEADAVQSPALRYFEWVNLT